MFRHTRADEGYSSLRNLTLIFYIYQGHLEGSDNATRQRLDFAGGSHLPHIRLAQGLDEVHVALHIAGRVVPAVSKHPALQASL